MHRYPLLAIIGLTLGSSVAHATDRVAVIAPPAGQDAAETLVGSLEGACNRGDFVGFLDHFTPSHRGRIHRRMEDIFIKHQPKMDVQQVMLLSEDETRITFGVRYAWHPKDAPEEVFSSKVTARRVAGEWKLDGEQVKAVSRTGGGSGYDRDDRAAGALGFNPFNPPADLIDPDLEHLRGDVGIRPGQGCADGRCGR